VEGTEAGATGAEGALGLAQHAGVRQWPQSQEHDLATFEFAGAASGDTAMTEPATRKNPSSRAIAILAGFSAMPVLQPFRKRQLRQT
jgi:hypothetical protein